VSATLWRYRIFAAGWLVYAGLYLCRKNFTVLIPILQNELHFTKLQLADMVFVYSAAYAGGQFLAGGFADRFGPRIAVTSGVLLSVAANIAMGFHPTVLLLTVFSLLNGLGQAQGWPGLLKNMASWFRPEERGVVMAWWTTNYVLGGFLATVFATFVLTSPALLPSFGWRRGLWLPALLLALIAAAYFALTRDRPADVGLPNIESDAAAIRGSATFYREIVRSPEVWIVAITALLLKITRYSFLFWLPLYITEQLHYSLADAGYLSSLYELVGFTGVVFAGYISDRVFQSRRFPVVTLMLLGLAGACALQPLFAGRSWWLDAAAVSLIGFMTYGPDTICQGAAIQDASPPGLSGSAAGFVNGIASCGQLASPYLIAIVAGTFGWERVFQLFIAIAVAAAALASFRWSYRAVLQPVTAE
jgi:sugar phosphate permease